MTGSGAYCWQQCILLAAVPNRQQCILLAAVHTVGNSAYCWQRCQKGSSALLAAVPDSSAYFWQQCILLVAVHTVGSSASCWQRCILLVVVPNRQQCTLLAEVPNRQQCILPFLWTNLWGSCRWQLQQYTRYGMSCLQTDRQCHCCCCCLHVTNSLFPLLHNILITVAIIVNYVYIDNILCSLTVIMALF